MVNSNLNSGTNIYPVTIDQLNLFSIVAKVSAIIALNKCFPTCLLFPTLILAKSLVF